MKKLLTLVFITAITAVSCATPDKPKTEMNTADTMHIPPPDTAKYKPDTTKF